jgi:hypothetical protein
LVTSRAAICPGKRTSAAVNNAAEKIGSPAALFSETMFSASLACALSLLLAATTSAPAQSAPAPENPQPQTTPLQIAQPPSTTDSAASAAGSISGTVVDKDGFVIANAKVVLTQAGSAPRESVSGSDGSFTFANVSQGPFDLAVSAPGFAPLEKSGSLQPGEALALPQLELSVAAKIEIAVAETQEQIAEQQIHEEERQRLLGIVPNFYVTYVPHPAPLTARQKFELAWKSSIDPVSIGISAAFAGAEQADDAFSGYGQGAEGYAKRFGANFADNFIGTFVGGAIFPIILKQDPRYFYKGTGTRRERLLYALAFSVICKGDNGRWQPNYSAILGGMAAGGISNLYYPASNRNGLRLTFVNAGINVGSNAAYNILQEFFMKRFTPHNPDTDPLPAN